MTQLRNLPRKPLINTRLRLLRRGGRIDVNLERDSPLTTRIRAKKPASPLCVLSIRVCSRHSWAKSACSHFRVHLCSFVVSRKLGNTTAGKPAPLGHERTGSRESACAAELSWGVAYRLAGLFAGHRLANPAGTATGDFAFRAGFPSGHGPKPDRGLVAETPHSALCQCDPADASLSRCHDHNYRFCHSPAGKTNAGTGTKCAQRLAGHSHSHRIGHSKLPGSSRGVATHR